MLEQTQGEIIDQGETGAPAVVATVRASLELEDKVAALQLEIERMVPYAQACTIASTADYERASLDIIAISKLKKQLEAYRKEFVDPIDAHRRIIQARFKVFSDPLAEADRIMQEKAKDWNRHLRELADRAAEIQRLQDKQQVQTGEIFNKPDPVPAPSTIVRTDMGSMSEMKVPRWELVDFTEVPDDYKQLNAGAITKQVKAGLTKIPGIRIWNDTTMQVRGKAGE